MNIKNINIIKKLLLIFIVLVLSYGGYIFINTRQKIIVLLYHSILPKEEFDEDNESVLDLKVFEEHMKYLYENGYSTITTKELEDYLCNKKPFDEKKVMITFDDGYLDNYFYAYDVLKKYDFTAVEFLIGHTIEKESKDFIPLDFPRFTLEDIENSKDVFEFASHSFNMHSIDDTVKKQFLLIKSEDEIKEDFIKSFDIPNTEKAFAYPFGMYNKQVVKVLKELDCKLAFTINRKYTTKRTSPFEVPRYSIHRSLSMADFIKIIEGAN